MLSCFSTNWKDLVLPCLYGKYSHYLSNWIWMLELKCTLNLKGTIKSCSVIFISSSIIRFTREILKVSLREDSNLKSWICLINKNYTLHHHHPKLENINSKILENPIRKRRSLIALTMMMMTQENHMNKSNMCSKLKLRSLRICLSWINS
jgi:hypothetical protein